MIKKILNFCYLTLICFSCNSFALLTQSKNLAITDNFDLSLIITRADYYSDLAIGSNLITLYRYLYSRQTPNLSEKIFILIPRNLNFDINNFDYNNQLDKMENFISKHSDNFDCEGSQIFAEVEQFADNLECDQEFIPHIKSALNGSHCLYSPENDSSIENFDGVDRVLSSAITPINSILINSKIFKNSNSTISNHDLMKLQFLLFKTAKEAQTVLFIPDCASYTNYNSLVQSFQLPVAIIKDVSIDNKQNIYLIFECLKPCIEINDSLRRFNDVKKNMQSNHVIDGLDNELINMHYVIKINDLESLNMAGIPIENTEDGLDTPEILQTTQPKLKKIDEDTFKYYFVTNNIDYQQPGVCKHYNRKCYVKFNCCDKFWSCHKCHNADTSCDQYKRSRDACRQMCVICKYEQDLNSTTGQYCGGCGFKFADYFCDICKHLTDYTGNVGHCTKCGICRFNADKLIHCDNCNKCSYPNFLNEHECESGMR